MGRKCGNPDSRINEEEEQNLLDKILDFLDKLKGTTCQLVICTPKGENVFPNDARATLNRIREGDLRDDEYRVTFATEFVQVTVGNLNTRIHDVRKYEWTFETEDSGDAQNRPKDKTTEAQLGEVSGVLATNKRRRDKKENIGVYLKRASKRRIDKGLKEKIKAIKKIRRSPTVGFSVSSLGRNPLLLACLVISFSRVTATITIDTIETVSCKEGTRSTLTFRHQWPPDSVLNPYFTAGIVGKDQPFCIDGNGINPEGVISQDQAGRIKVFSSNTEHGFTVTIEFDPVKAEDEGTYMVEMIPFGTDGVQSTCKYKKLNVHVPPGKAQCFITGSQYSANLHEIHCHAKRGTANSTLCCFQEGEKIPYMGEEVVVNRRTFWLRSLSAPVFCCSHDLSEEVDEESCQDYRWPPVTLPQHDIVTKVQATNPNPTEGEMSRTTLRSGCQSLFGSFGVHSIIVGLATFFLNHVLSSMFGFL